MKNYPINDSNNLAAKIKNVFIWTILPLTCLIVFNLYFFNIYSSLNLDKSYYQLVWGYIDSSVFKVITASLLLPVLLFLFEKLFKYKETASERTYQMKVIEKNKADENKKKRKEEQKENQIKALESTEEIWREIFKIATKVRYYQGNEDVIKIFKDFEKYRIRGFEVANSWHLRFPKISEEDKALILYPFNVFNGCILTVANIIHKKKM